jgi:DMSO/TMAO reductase YedYZ molybdopterin-dependent catalytic subunit
MSVWLPRRAFLRAAGAGVVGAWGCDRRAPPAPVPGEGAWPGKASDLIVLTERPPNLEMPQHYLSHDLTPNDAMFVRWHVSGLPAQVDTRTFRLQVTGHVERPLELSLDELKRSFRPASIVAVNQCSGNGRSTFDPRVPGVQWTGGAVGNARWTGVRLRDVLAKAGVKAGAVSVAVKGLDRPPLDTTPHFEKALDVAQALEPDVLVAWAMNDAALPMLNGFPLRLVVPGWYSTYWVKALATVTVLPGPFDGYWMTKAYRIPSNDGADESPSELATDTAPIARMNVRSLFARPLGGETLRRGEAFAIEGVAFDSGSGIARVEVSTDGGASFRAADLGTDLGGYSFRRWRATWTPVTAGPATLVVRATSASGETQRTARRWNRAGYMKNEPERVEVMVS